MAIIKRLVKGSALTHAEMDGNFTELENKASTVAEGFNTILTFNKNKHGSTNQSGNISFTLATSGNLDGIVIRYKITSDGVNTITFPAGFNVFNKPDDNIYPAGVHIFYFNYIGGDVDVAIPSYVAEITPTEPTGDTEDPTIPTGLTLVSKTDTTVDLSWTASTDNTGVDGYLIYRDGIYVKEVAGLTGQVTGLTAETLYNFTVSAIDAAGNESAQSTALSVTTNAAPVTSTGMIGDDYIGAAVIYALKKERSAYTGPCIKVRRSADNVSQDFGFDANGNLDIAAVQAFVSTGTGHVSTWYDQSGNARHWVADLPGTTAEPLIIDAGVTQLKNGTPAILTKNSNVRFTAAFTGVNPSTDFMVIADNTTNSVALANDTGSGYYGVMTSAAATSPHSEAVGTPNYYVNGTQVVGATRGDLHTAIRGDSPKLVVVTNLDLSAWVGYASRYTSTALFGPRFMQARFLFANDKSALRTEIEAAITSKYGIV